jgi:hypothetical protein
MTQDTPIDVTDPGASQIESARVVSDVEPRPAGTVAIQVAAAASVFAGLIHYAVVPEHRSEWWLYAVFFTLLAAFEVVWAAAVWTGRDRRLLLLGVVVNAAVLALWTVSRSTGLPFGPDTGDPEPVGVPDLLCDVAELATIGAALLAVRLIRRDPSAGNNH